MQKAPVKEAAAKEYLFITEVSSGSSTLADDEFIVKFTLCYDNQGVNEETEKITKNFNELLNFLEEI
ncbi:hypothetical protein [Mesobacillus harenae]|uniref:hypothetical protein n=1 Tax=Mesobacillus harenae TaxID=2213203 RepID=UPI00157FE9F5|nr:hypothetical protein [Mesobacillus harenae]